jgi:O-antigen ligase
VLALGVIPVVYSLNRGLWIDLTLLGGYLAVRLAMRGRLWAVGTATVALAVVAALMLATPLGHVVRSRMENGKSNNVRMFVTERALDGVWQSPVIGLGTTRNTQGSDRSIAIGGTDSCQRCGAHTIGGNGQLWQVLYLHGVLGTALYIGFFVLILWRYRKDSSPIGLAGSGAILVSLASMFYYNALVTPLAFTFLSYVLLWRNASSPSKETHVTSVRPVR